MSIRINLLAEQLAEEELRRRDPVKRAVLGACALAALLVAWGGYLQVRLARAQGEVAAVEAQFRQVESQFKLVRTNQNRIAQADRKVAALRQMTTNRFLWGPALNALQFAMVDNVQVVRLKADQTFTLTEGTKAVTNASTVTKGRPPSVKEKVLLSIEARDYSTQPGGQILNFQGALNSNAYFQANLKKAELTGRSAPQADATDSSRMFVLFTIDCQYPERSR
jgi:hypothetical protein